MTPAEFGTTDDRSRRPEDRWFRIDVRSRALLAFAVVLAGGAVLAPAAPAEVVRITSDPAADSDAPDVVAIAAFPATADAGRIAGLPVAGLPDDVATFEAAPPGGPVAYAGQGPTGPAPADRFDDQPHRPLAGLVPLGGGPVVPFTGPTGGPLGRAFRPYSNAANDQPDPWITWAPDGASLVLHAVGRDPRADPWFAAPASRRCVVATARCEPVAPRDVVDLPGGGTVQVDAGLTAPIGANRSLGRDSAESRVTTKRFRARAGRRYAVTVRVAGRPGPAATWTTSGVLRTGAPAYDRSYASAAGVLVRTSRVRAPRSSGRDAYESVGADAGRAAIVRADGTIRSLGRFGYEVVGTLPDGRWVLTGGSGERFERGPTGLPLSTLDADGRIAPITSGTRPVSPVWAASTAGLPDSLSTTAKVEHAGVDGATGLLVLVLRFSDDDGGGRVVAVTPDGSAPPRLLRDAPGRPSDDDYVVR
ncbi:hypothetical protein AB0L40_10000 [Patulibacter sp. NPDC049589]|uniref:hypothetical protein n=1 Tax=Patulibacter sp. NPDC049589 TaxID=3154731 RepID=UPI0034434EA1